MSNVTINTEVFWTDPSVRSMTKDARYLYLYTITNSHIHYSGIYYLPVSLMTIETGMSQADINKTLKGLAEHVLYDNKFMVVFVKKMLKHQVSRWGLGRNLTIKQIKGIENHLESLHGCPLVYEFHKQYPGLVDMGEGLPLSPPIPDSSIAETPPKDEPIDLSPKFNYDACFELFWKAYPARRGKKNCKQLARNYFNSKPWPGNEFDLLMQAVVNYAATGELPKDAIRFLKADFWREWVDKPESIDTGKDEYAELPYFVGGVQISGKKIDLPNKFRKFDPLPSIGDKKD